MNNILNLMRLKVAHFFFLTKNYVWKSLLTIALLIALGLPIASVSGAIILFFSLTLIIVTPKLTNTSLLYQKPVFVLILFLVLLTGKHLLPVLNINMGSNLYLPSLTAKDSEYPDLPSPVLAYLQKHFHSYYPYFLKKQDHEQGNWQNFLVKPSRTYAYSTESIWKKTNMSNYVHHINFNSLNSLKESFINNFSSLFGDYNAYGTSNQPTRKDVPFFVAYQFPKNAIGSKLCWQGSAFWHNQFIDHPTVQCQRLTTSETGENAIFYGISFPKYNNLLLHLLPPYRYHFFSFARSLLSLAMVVLILFSIQIRRSHLFKIGLFMILALPQIFVLSLTKLSLPLSHLAATHILNGGADGLEYAGSGREIFYYLSQGKFIAALKGGAAIFNFMPLQRYFDALYFFIFGESSLYALFFTLAIFITLYYYMDKTSTNHRNYRISMAVNMILLIFLMHLFFQLSVGNMSGSTAFPIFMTGLCLLINKNNNRLQYNHLFLVSILFSLATMLRPNILIATFFILFYMNIRYRAEHPAQARGTIWRPTILSVIGFSPIFLVALHNWYYGHKFVLFTKSSFCPQNFELSPYTYWLAAKGIFNNQQSNSALEKIIHHLERWFPNILLFFCFSLCFWIFYATKNKALKLMALAAILLQIPSIFWVGDTRHVLLGRILSIIASLMYLFNWLPISRLQFFHFSTINKKKLKPNSLQQTKNT